MVLEQKNLEQEIVVPMGFDSHMGALRAVYPIEDAFCLIHGAHGCDYQGRGYLGWSAASRLALGSTGMMKQDIIYGGEELLEKTLYEVIEATHPRLVVVQCTCVPTLIGDDAEGVAAKVTRKTGTKIIVTWNPNYRGSQLEGFISTVNKYVTQLMLPPEKKLPKTVNILGAMPAEHNSQNDIKELVRILNGIGLNVNTILLEKGATADKIMRAPEAEANVLFYPEVGLPTARLMQERFGVPYVETILPPLGVESSKEWVLKVAEHFSLSEEAKKFIDGELKEMGQGLYGLMEGEIYSLVTLCGKSYAINAVSYRIPALVKFLSEEFGMVPWTLGIQEFEESSYNKLLKILDERKLSPDIIENGDYLKFMSSIRREFEYPRGKPHLLFGNTIDAYTLYSTATRLPLIRYSFPVLDENIVHFAPFVGFRGVVFLTERMWNIFQGLVLGTLFPSGGYIPGHYDLKLEDIRRTYSPGQEVS